MGSGRCGCGWGVHLVTFGIFFFHTFFFFFTRSFHCYIGWGLGLHRVGRTLDL